MIEDLKPYTAQIGIEAILQNKTRSFFLFLSLLITSIFSAQQSFSTTNTTPEPLISIVGNAVIYSKNQDFNEQICSNKNLQENLKVEISKNGYFKISNKNTEKKEKPAISFKKKKENIVLATKEKTYKSTLPKKEIIIKINRKDFSTEFLCGFSISRNSFITPYNNSSLSKIFVEFNSFQVRISIKYPNKLNYYYKNRNLKQQIGIYELSVRPPPSLLS